MATRGGKRFRLFSVYFSCRVGVGDFAGEGNQRLEGQVLLFHHFAEGQIELDGVQARAGDDHRPALALNGVQGLLQEVVEHDAGLLLDGVRGQIHIGGEQADGFLLFVFVVGGDGLDQLEVTLEGGVILEHVQNEVLFDGLAHGIDVMGDELPVRVLVTEQLKRLVLGRGGEGKIGDVTLPPAGVDLPDDLVFQIVARLVFDFGLLQIDGESLLEMFGGLSRLAGVGFVDDDGEALAFELGHAGRDDRELLQGGDDDGFAGLQARPAIGPSLCRSS